MIRQETFYSTHFETIVALTTYLAVSESGEIDSANAFRLAKQLGLQLEDVQLVLDNATGIFRKSIKEYHTRDFGYQHNYTLQLRYARRIYEGGSISNIGDTLSNEELFSLLNFIMSKVREEQETKRQQSNNLITMIAAILAALLSLISLIVTSLP
jgi:hypothetical protein